MAARSYALGELEHAALVRAAEVLEGLANTATAKETCAAGILGRSDRSEEPRPPR